MTRPKVSDLRPHVADAIDGVRREIRESAARELNAQVATVVGCVISFVAGDYLLLIAVGWLAGFGGLAGIAASVLFAQVVIAEFVALFVGVGRAMALRRVARGTA